MGLNDIQLPEFIIEEWFKDNLIIPTPESNGGAFAPITPGSSNNTLPGSSNATPPVPSTPLPPTAQAPNTTPPNTTPSNTTPPNTTPPIKFLGSNRRHITLLVHAPASPFLPDNQLAFLTKILEACRMTLADVALVNNAATPITVTELKQLLQPKTILLFGLEPSAIRLPINFPTFKPLDYDGCTYLSAPDLEQLVSNTEESKLLKSKLWVCLKRVFTI
jgi:hypothetical protein